MKLPCWIAVCLCLCCSLGEALAGEFFGKVQNYNWSGSYGKDIIKRNNSELAFTSWDMAAYEGDIIIPAPGSIIKLVPADREQCGAVLLKPGMPNVVKCSPPQKSNALYLYQIFQDRLPRAPQPRQVDVVVYRSPSEEPFAYSIMPPSLLVHVTPAARPLYDRFGPRGTPYLVIGVPLKEADVVVDIEPDGSTLRLMPGRRADRKTNAFRLFTMPGQTEELLRALYGKSNLKAAETLNSVTGWPDVQCYITIWDQNGDVVVKEHVYSPGMSYPLDTPGIARLVLVNHNKESFFAYVVGLDLSGSINFFSGENVHAPLILQEGVRRVGANKLPVGPGGLKALRVIISRKALDLSSWRQRNGLADANAKYTLNPIQGDMWHSQLIPLQRIQP